MWDHHAVAHTSTGHTLMIMGSAQEAGTSQTGTDGAMAAVQNTGNPQFVKTQQALTSSLT